MMTPAADPPAVVDVDVSVCEDGKTLHVWQTLADGTVTLWTFTLGDPIGQAQTPLNVIEGM